MYIMHDYHRRDRKSNSGLSDRKTSLGHGRGLIAGNAGNAGNAGTWSKSHKFAYFHLNFVFSCCFEPNGSQNNNFYQNYKGSGVSGVSGVSGD